MKLGYYLIIGIIIVVGIIIISYIPRASHDKGEAALIGGIVVNADIQTPHPYPNSNSGRQIVWNYTLDLSDTNTTSIKLHFNEFEIKGLITKTGELIEYPPCPTQTPSVEVDENGTVIGISGQTEERCGTVFVKYTTQEIYDNYLQNTSLIEGDFLLIKDSSGNVVDILSGSSDVIPSYYITPPEDEIDAAKWWYTYGWPGPPVNKLLFEFYADESENGYGIYIDKYARAWL